MIVERLFSLGIILQTLIRLFLTIWNAAYWPCHSYIYVCVCIYVLICVICMCVLNPCFGLQRPKLCASFCYDNRERTIEWKTPGSVNIEWNAVKILQLNKDCSWLKKSEKRKSTSKPLFSVSSCDEDFQCNTATDPCPVWAGSTWEP